MIIIYYPYSAHVCNYFVYVLICRLDFERCWTSWGMFTRHSPHGTAHPRPPEACDFVASSWPSEHSEADVSWNENDRGGGGLWMVGESGGFKLMLEVVQFYWLLIDIQWIWVNDVGGFMLGCSPKNASMPRSNYYSLRRQNVELFCWVSNINYDCWWKNSG